MSREQFEIDLERGKKAEYLVYQVLSSLTTKYKFKMVNDIPEFYHKGDILASAADGTEIFIDVKDDTVISTSGNVLCEDEVYFKYSDYYAPGFMYSDYDILCVLSRAENKMYLIDFKKLKEIYKLGDFKRINHTDQYSDCYLINLALIKKYGALIKIINY